MSEIPDAVQKELERLEARYELNVKLILKELDSLKFTLGTMKTGLIDVDDQVKQLAQIIDGIAAKVVTTH